MKKDGLAIFSMAQKHKFIQAEKYSQKKMQVRKASGVTIKSITDFKRNLVLQGH